MIPCCLSCCFHISNIENWSGLGSLTRLNGNWMSNFCSRIDTQGFSSCIRWTPSSRMQNRTCKVEMSWMWSHRNIPRGFRQKYTEYLSSSIWDFLFHWFTVYVLRVLSGCRCSWWFYFRTVSLLFTDMISRVLRGTERNLLASLCIIFTLRHPWIMLPFPRVSKEKNASLPCSKYSICLSTVNHVGLDPIM